MIGLSKSTQLISIGSTVNKELITITYWEIFTFKRYEWAKYA